MIPNHQPLADLLRPQTLKHFVGQPHLVGKNQPIRLAIEKGQVQSMIFWGPPGCGKTTLAHIIANQVQASFHHLSAVAAGKADVKKIIDQAQQNHSPQQPLHHTHENPPSNSRKLTSKTILFLDEIHRFNKTQQDYLLPYVEDGTITLIGATTENPSFSVISPLLSRCQIFVFEPLTSQELKELVRRGCKTLSTTNTPASLPLSSDALNLLIQFSNGDARQALNLLETTHHLYHHITVKNLQSALQSKFLRYDRAGDEHYHTISAFIKSMRASQPDAALYYLARMVNAGQDPLFIARRMVIFASEDIGMAQPTALVVANAVFNACQVIGYPECAINLAHGTAYLAKAKKDRSSYDALRAAQTDVKKLGNLPIPPNLKNAPTSLMKKLGYGQGYEMYPNEAKNLLPKKLKGRKYYQRETKESKQGL